MGEFIIYLKRLLKITPKNTGPHENMMEGIVQETTAPQNTISSATSSKYQQSSSRFENGREYTEQENIQYILPKDIEEQDRLHQQHWMLKIAFQGNFEARVEEELKKGITVLDSGCGPATWTLEMAEMYPNSIFHGMDMAPVFPEQVKPQNCEFRLGNLNEKLPYPDNYFDYIHQRLLVVGLTAEGWENALKELFRVLKPGGWIELKEIQATAERLGPQTKSMNQYMQRVFKSKGFIPDVACDLDKLLKTSGFEEINVLKLIVPLNHGGKLGSMHWVDLRKATASVKPVLMMMDPETYKTGEDFDKALEEVGTECSDNKSVANWFAVCGRKPLSSKQ